MTPEEIRRKAEEILEKNFASVTGYGNHHYYKSTCIEAMVRFSDFLKAGEGKWIPVSERLPEIGENGWSEGIIVFDGKRVIDDVMMTIIKPRNSLDANKTIFRTGAFGYSYDSFEVKGVTHWQPLPPAPADNVKEK